MAIRRSILTPPSIHAVAVELVSVLARRGHLLRIEINGASLEDIFVELTQKSGGRS